MLPTPTEPSPEHSGVGKAYGEGLGGLQASPSSGQVAVGTRHNHQQGGRETPKQQGVPVWMLRQAGNWEELEGCPGAPGLASGTLMVLKLHTWTLFTEGGCHQQGCDRSVGQNH